MRHFHRRMFTVLFVIASAVPVSAQLVSKMPNQEVMTLEFDSALMKRLASIEDFLSEK